MIQVEWGKAKWEQNLAKHGVDFADAAEIFLGPVFERVDTRKDYGEERRIALGRHGDQYYVVVYTWRGDICRLISAWKASKNDRRAYDQIFN